uniref:histidine--tRNA ligase n=1 Tax=Populus trichocarpa TaxID=3694 RepID=A0A2K2A155_POPTR|eukprot:XP_024460461.1 histidine--tRNA ligase, chloroplastic/mitochondrial-like [Populus trichocarpa]
MPPFPSSLHIFHPSLNHYLKPNFFSLSYFSISAPKFPLSSQLIPFNPRTLSSVATALSASENGSGGGGERSAALAGPPVLENSVQKIDVNPPKGTRDFPPEEMRLRGWLFHNFKEVSRLFGFEEVDYPVLESEALFIRKAGEEIRDQLYCFEDRGNRRVALRPDAAESCCFCI